ncbi:ABC transporter ATP-binding protein [Actinomadura sp. 7K507]|uniref:ABC transporter ATP-binding protein n=1 Tax=Actinomadura sp. 7K507 TaxID=2530365 RepID=UPI00104B5F40|nr:ABC transporter ATP-binding protein [Actinomadura sp. 7K507]TDC92997.1 ABC transporter ATP-binding protein [Actinomadura sp. 7K507]
MAGSGREHLRGDAVLRVEGLDVRHKIRRGVTLQAVSDLSFDIARGETLGVVGESGCGKSSAAMAVMQLAKRASGSVHLGGEEISGRSAGWMRRHRRDMQLVFQAPRASLNPRRRVGETIAEGIRIWGQPDVDGRVEAVMRSVGLDPALRDRFPEELSGGQCQRVSIARALAVEPRLLVCDEPVSALDVSVQAQVLNLLKRLRRELDLSMMFISHDLGVVNFLSDRILVLYLGKTCELAPPSTLFAEPRHPYTHTLISALPAAAARGIVSKVAPRSEVPSLISPPAGCRFNTRCLLATDRCREEEPRLRNVGPDHWVACHHPVSSEAVTPTWPRASPDGGPGVTV